MSSDNFDPGATGNGSRRGAYLSPLTVVALSFGYAVGWGAFVMPGTTFLPNAGQTAIGVTKER